MLGTGATLGGDEGIIGTALPASARMRGVITGVGAVENEAAGAASGAAEGGSRIGG